jgi:hypothetical protein
LWEFNRSRLFNRNPLIFNESAYEGSEAGFMVFTVEPCHVPSTERGLHREIKETASRVSLKAYIPDNLSVRGTRLVLQKEIILEQREVMRDS